MPDTILSGDFTVYYKAENRQKRIVWTGTDPDRTTRSVNELYSALQDLFDELTQLDDGTPMSAQTPTEYTIGNIDTGAADPWFIDRVTVEHLTGGALRTAGWARSISNTGVVRVTVNNTSIAVNDIGSTVTHASGDTGTLLDVKGTGANSTLWIRPTDETAANDWDTTSGTITASGSSNTATQSAAAVTGESLWANIFTLGTIENNTHMLIEQQPDTRLVGYKTSNNTDWWEDGHVDILINVVEVGVEVDEGYIKVFARQQSKTYSFFQTNLATGGRNPIPLQTGNDLDNQYGYRQIVTKAPVTGDAFDEDDIGKVIFKQSDPTLRAVVTAVSGSSPAFTIQYYYIGDPIHTDSVAREFANNDVIVTDEDTPKTATIDGAPTSVNAPTYTNVTVTFPSTLNDFAFDVDENDTDERYSIRIDLQNITTLDEMQQYLKYITRRGATNLLNGQQGQFYIGSEYRIRYTSSTPGDIAIGAEVTQAVTNATGVVVAHHTTVTPRILVLRSTRGTFNATNDITDGTNTISGSAGNIASSSAITPNAASPFGTFAGGTFFGAAGVLVVNVPGADAVRFQLITDAGAVVRPPNKVTVRVGNTRTEDRVAVFRLNIDGIIDKEEYLAAVAVAGDITIGVSSPALIAVDVPGKINGGVLRIVDVSAQNEYRLRYNEWAGSEFTLSTTSGTATGGTQTSLINSGASFTTTVEVGDLVYNSTETAYAYVMSIESDTELITTNLNSSSPITDWNGDSYVLNAVPTAITTSDYIYIPLLDRYEDDGTDSVAGFEESTLTYSVNIACRVVARNANDTASNTTPMLPYSADALVTATGLTNNIIRSKDNIKS